MSSSALDSALSGLRIAQQQLNVISTNIANVQTPGYTRKILPQSVRAVAGVAVGVSADTIIRKVDLSLSRDLWTQVSSVGGLETKIKYLDQVQRFHGSPDSENAISAEIAALKDRFSALSDDPQDPYASSAVINQAQDTALKINDFADLVTKLRNDTEDEIGTAVSAVNSLLEQIAEQNRQVQANRNQQRSTATFEDLRDQAISDLAQYIDISFFQRGDGVMVVQTTTGIQLTDQNAETIFFEKANIGADKYYPASVNGIYLGGDPTSEPTAFDMIPFGLGGKMGALVDLRDKILPQYQAQIDEMAFRMAQRFDSLGLRLFTDASGQIPADTAPVPDPPGPLTPVDYVGFAREITVNPNIVDDPTLLQSGTEGDSIQSGSNEVIRRVLEFSFGTLEYESVTGSRDVRVSVNPAGDTLQENFGLFSQNLMKSTKNLAEYTTDVNAAAGNPFTATTDDFTLRIYDTRIGADSGTITIDLSAAAAAYPIGGAGLGTGIGTVDNAAEQLASYINAQTWPADLAVSATVNTYGQLSISTRGNITVGGGSMGTDGLDFLGLTAGTTTTTDPYFDIQVGASTPVRITIEPGDTETDLVTKIDAVPGIDTADIVINGSGHLSFRPQRGGDIKVIGGPFTSDAAGFSTAGGLGIIEEIFGAADPIVAHDHAAFRSSNLGPSVTLDSRIISATSLIDFSQKMVNTQTQDQVTTTNLRDDQEQYRATLEKKLLDQSAVNIDEELAHLIVIQNAYAAAARAISTVDQMFDDLLNSI